MFMYYKHRLFHHSPHMRKRKYLFAADAAVYFRTFPQNQPHFWSCQKIFLYLYVCIWLTLLHIMYSSVYV